MDWLSYIDKSPVREFWNFFLQRFLRYMIYRISSVVRRSFFSFLNNPKDLDPSYKTDLDL